MFLVTVIISINFINFLLNLPHSPTPHTTLTTTRWTKSTRFQITNKKCIKCFLLFILNIFCSSPSPPFLQMYDPTSFHQQVELSCYDVLFSVNFIYFQEVFLCRVLELLQSCCFRVIVAAEGILWRQRRQAVLRHKKR